MNDASETNRKAKFVSSGFASSDLAQSDVERNTETTVFNSQDQKILAFFLDIVFSYFYTFGNCNTRVADSM
jgi:hypothetical protein